MSDARLRELERCWRTSGRVEDEAAWLAERVRQCELAPQRLLAAAHAGHAAAQLAAPEARASADLVVWARELRDLGPQAMSRAAMAAAACAVEAIEDGTREEWTRVALGLVALSELPVLERRQKLVDLMDHVEANSHATRAIVAAASQVAEQGDGDAGPAALELAARAFETDGATRVRAVVERALIGWAFSPQQPCQACGLDLGFPRPCHTRCEDCGGRLDERWVCQVCRLPRLTIGEDEELEFVRMIARGRRKDERHARWLGVLMLAGTVFTLLGVIPDIIVREATGWSGHPGLIAGAILAVAASVRALRRLPPLPDDSPV